MHPCGQVNDPITSSNLHTVCKINNLLRTVSSENIENQLDVLDDGLRSALSSIVKAPVSEYVWLQANLLYRLGGLGLSGAKRSASAAFCSSIIQTKFLADIILSPEASYSSATFSLSFPGEDSAFQLTLSQLGGKVNLVDLQLASQHHLQGLIDQELFDELLTFLDVSGRARLNALAGSSDTSSWLRAPPIASLGLQIPPCDFSIACRLWLGIASFRADPPTRCPCGSQIDPPGYHLLSCGHGPWKIKRCVTPSIKPSYWINQK